MEEKKTADTQAHNIYCGGGQNTQSEHEIIRLSRQHNRGIQHGVGNTTREGEAYDAGQTTGYNPRK